MTETDGLLLIPRLRVQNANAISGPLTWGFPPPTAFLGFAHALERRLRDTLDLRFTGVAIVCHEFEPLTTRPARRHYQVFNLMRPPVRATHKWVDRPSAIVEEGRAHMTVSLLLETEGDLDDQMEVEDALEQIAATVEGMRLAGGSILPGSPNPEWQPWYDGEESNRKAFRRLRRRLLPGFALVHRPDLLAERLAAMTDENPAATALDALLDLSALHVEPETGEQGEVRWRCRRPDGWLVPLLVGYSALTGLFPPGEVAGVRDAETSARFVEAAYSLGQWISPHRIPLPGPLMWRYPDGGQQGIYCCTNPDYKSHLNKENIA